MAGAECDTHSGPSAVQYAPTSKLIIYVGFPEQEELPGLLAIKSCLFTGFSSGEILPMMNFFPKLNEEKNSEAQALRPWAYTKQSS